jgi:hypothetical protein
MDSRTEHQQTESRSSRPESLTNPSRSFVDRFCKVLGIVALYEAELDTKALEEHFELVESPSI